MTAIIFIFSFASMPQLTDIHIMKITKATMTRFISLTKNLVTKVKVLPTKHLNSQHLFLLMSFSSLWRLIYVNWRLNFIIYLHRLTQIVPNWFPSKHIIWAEKWNVLIFRNTWNWLDHSLLCKWTLSRIIRTWNFYRVPNKKLQHHKVKYRKKGEF